MPVAPRQSRGRVRRVMVALTTAGIAAVMVGRAVAPASPRPVTPDISVRLDVQRDLAGGDIPRHFVGLSLEWTLVDRYLGPQARPVFANLLRNLDTGVLRIGGGSQDLLRFERTAGHPGATITPADLADIRATLDTANGVGAQAGAPNWGVILGTAMAPRTAELPWVGRRHLRSFLRHGVAAAFAGDARRDVAGIELGNEVDVSYPGKPGSYLRDFAAYSRETAPFGIVGPSTSAVIAPWARIEARKVPTRFFWQWRSILDAVAPALQARAGAFGAFASDHFYAVARGCHTDRYRCASISRLLSDERAANFRQQVYVHAREAAAHGLGYRVAELNSAANRGAPSVSDVAASAVWAVEAMFDAACPQPPGGAAANADCHTGAIGVNFHSAEVRNFASAAQGNAYYNPINYDATAAKGAPTPAPEYYALLLFARFAQATRALRPVALAGTGRRAASVKAWRVDPDASRRRLFLINTGNRPVTLSVAAPGSSYELDRMTPSDPTGRGRTLDAPTVRIDGQEVSPDGTWPGFRPASGAITGGRLRVTLGRAEAVVLTLDDPSNGPNPQMTET
jgi:hypothetical protein